MTRFQPYSCGANPTLSVGDTPTGAGLTQSVQPVAPHPHLSGKAIVVVLPGDPQGQHPACQGSGVEDLQNFAGFIPTNGLLHGGVWEDFSGEKRGAGRG